MRIARPSPFAPRFRAGRVRAAALVVVASAAVCLAGCAKQMTPMQRQALETTYIDAPLPDVFRATRTAFQNEGYTVEQSELASGFLQFSRGVRTKSTGTAFALGFLPGGGSFYVGNYGLGVLDLLLWPFSVLWDPAVSAAAASDAKRDVKVSVTMVELGARTELRAGFADADFDDEYGIFLKRVYAEVQRQVMLREHRDATMGAPPASGAAPVKPAN
ncbi:MAG: hypothetical protein U0610_00220 [bacterium]